MNTTIITIRLFFFYLILSVGIFCLLFMIVVIIKMVLREREKPTEKKTQI